MVEEEKGSPHPLVLDFGCTVQSPRELLRNTDAHALTPGHLSSLARSRYLFQLVSWADSNV